MRGEGKLESNKMTRGSDNARDTKSVHEAYGSMKSMTNRSKREQEKSEFDFNFCAYEMQ